MYAQAAGCNTIIKSKGCTPSAAKSRLCLRTPRLQGVDAYPGREMPPKQGICVPWLGAACVLLGTSRRERVVRRCSKRPKQSPSHHQGTTTARQQGLQLRQLIDDVNSFSSTSQALQRFKVLQFVPKRAVEERSAEMAQCIDNMLRRNGGGTASNTVRLLFTVSKAVKGHPALVKALHASRHRDLILQMFQVCTEDDSVYRKSIMVSQLCSAQYNLRIYHGGFWERVSEAHAYNWDAQAASNVVYAYGKLHNIRAAPYASACVEKLLIAAAVEHAGGMTPQAVANTIWALAVLDLDLGEAHEPLMQAIRQVADSMNAQDVTNTMWACAKLDLNLGEVQEPLVDAIVRVADSMRAQAVANTMWAFATLDVGLGEAREPLMDAIVRVAGRMTEQEVGSTMRAFARLDMQLGEAHEPLMQAIMKLAVRMKPQAVANTLWAFAKLDLELAHVRGSLVKAAVRVAVRMNAQDVSNTMWALAKLDAKLGMARVPLTKAVVRVASNMNSQAVANTLWAFATLYLKLGVAHEPLMKAVVRVSGNMNAQAVANTMWAFATLDLKLGVAHEPLMEAIVRVADSMQAQGIVNTLWAAGTLRVEDLGAAHGALLRVVPKFSEKLEPRHIPQISLGLEWLLGQQLGTSRQAQEAEAAVEAARKRLQLVA